MKRKASNDPSNDDVHGKERHVAMLTSRIQGETYSGFYSLPETLRHIVADYVSYDKRDPTKRALLFEQRITLGFSEPPKLDLGSCWHFGCLSSENRWKSSIEVKVDTSYLIKDYKSCLDFLGRENLSYCPMIVEGLVFQLDISSENISSTLDDLEYTLTMLETHLNKVQHVVFVLEKYAFCCFSLKDVIDSATRLRQAVDRPHVLRQIISDFRTCWATNQTLSTRMLLDYYIMNDDKPKSDKYLTKFVISVSHSRNRDLFGAVDPNLNSSKLYWLYNFETRDDMKSVDQKITRRCNAFHFDKTTTPERVDVGQFVKLLESNCCFEDNPFIERIVVDAYVYGIAWRLPRPSEPLTDTTVRSALIELTLKGDNTLDLTQLNTGYFPNLRHLSIIEGTVTGCLDSQSVPNLKTLWIDPRKIIIFVIPSKVDALIHEHTQAIINADRPWQLVTSDELGGWSLASYDESFANPQDDEKEDFSHPLPLIRELLLVAFKSQKTDEWQSQLNGEAPLEAIAGDRSVRRLVWAPERVEKIAAFSMGKNEFQLVFEDAVPGQTRILTSLECHGVCLHVNGNALPYLKSLKLNRKLVKLSGTFSHLETLSLENVTIKSAWQVDAPLLQSFICHQLNEARYLSLCPQLLPHLSYMRIEEFSVDPVHCLVILVDENSLALSHVKHAVFFKNIALFPFFIQCQLYNLVELELKVNPLNLPAGWRDVVWLCETLRINVCVDSVDFVLNGKKIVTVVLPELPQVKTLTVIEEDCHVLLDSMMPNLTDCTVPLPSSLGPHLKCPLLRHICFAGKLSKSEKEKCLDPATYETIGARPIWVYFGDSGEVKRMSWDAAPSATGVSFFAGLLEEVD